MEVLDALDRAAVVTSTVVNGIRADQLSAQTPCTEWDVRSLMSHMAGVCNFFAAVASREPADRPQPGLAEGASRDDAVNKVATAARPAADSWRKPGALDGACQLPPGEMPRQMAVGINLIDLYGHTWDLAKATGQQLPEDPELVSAVWSFAQQIVPGTRQRGAFAAEITVGAEASEMDRLVGFLGRQP
ncbi:MAG: TIGR03086 family metal-binding protein [Chloroflexota bacterium]